MIEFQQVMQRMKEILSKQMEKEKILDKDIADSLQLDPQYFAVIKKRRKIPYESLAHFSTQYDINLNWILLAQQPTYLQNDKNM
ncbi:MAG: hypothetical protein RLZZ428_377 [Pseudomonadota bacterium]|jgi:hypothetical protein